MKRVRWENGERPDDATAQQSPPGLTRSAGMDNPTPSLGFIPLRCLNPPVRSKTPLFARPHRRTIPPVGSAIQTEARPSAERFSSVPQVATAELAASAAGPVAAPPAVTPPALAPHAPVPPVAAEAIPPIRNVPPVFVPAMAPVAVPPVVAHATSAAPAVQPPSILGKLFKPAAPSTAPAGQTPATEAAPAALGSLFDRLRGNAPTPATPAPHSWLTNGPRRS